ncbi:MAG: helix-turn-helix domain-containing protein, partial [Verrucomicrobia bacterium]|nr:helix-turn-helix domain-containing protein [Verrucomicrobiota bacterium]
MRLQTEPKMAADLDKPIRTLRDWRYRKIIPYYKIGRSVLYDPEEVRKALQKF